MVDEYRRCNDLNDQVINKGQEHMTTWRKGNILRIVTYLDPTSVKVIFENHSQARNPSDENRHTNSTSYKILLVTEYNKKDNWNNGCDEEEDDRDNMSHITTTTYIVATNPTFLLCSTLHIEWATYRHKKEYNGKLQITSPRLRSILLSLHAVHQTISLKESTNHQETTFLSTTKNQSRPETKEFAS